MTPTQLDQAVLQKYVTAAAHGDKEAMGALYDALYDRLYAYAYRRTLEQAASQDIVANSFYKILTSIGAFAWKHEAGFYGWVFRITAHEIATYYRQANKYVLQEDWLQVVDNPNSEASDIHSNLQIDEEYRELHGAVARLPEKYRTAIELYYFGGLNHAEIAAALSIREGAARVRLHRAVEALQKALGGEQS